MTHGLRPYATYEDSGIPWLGAIPDHWELRRGKTLFRKVNKGFSSVDPIVTCFRDGVVTRRDRRRTTGFTNALQEIGYQGVHAGDLVIHAMDAFAGAVGVSDSNGKCSPVYAVCEAQEDANPWYYARCIREMAYSGWVTALAKGIRERSTDFRFEEFGRQFIPVPSPEEQNAIVRHLDYMDRRIRRYIAAKQRLIKLLEEQKQAIIQQAVTRGLDPNVRLKPSGVEWLGDIPEHWEVRRIGHLARVGNGSTPSRSNSAYWSVGNTPWLNSSCVNSERVTASNQFVTRLALAECHLPLVSAGSVLVAITGQGKTRGKASILDFESTINQHLAFVTPRSGAGYSEFLRLVLTGAYGELRRISDDSGSTKGALTCADLKAFQVPIPPFAEQKEIVHGVGRDVGDIALAISKAQVEIELVREYRMRLIADVVTGKLDVRGVELPDDDYDEDIVDVDIEDAELDEMSQEAAESEDVVI